MAGKGGRKSTTWTKENPPPGRPPAEKSLTKALRDKVDPQEMAERILALARDKDKGIALKATTYIYDRIDGTPIQSLRTQSDDLPQIIITGPGVELDKADSGDTSQASSDQEATP